MIELKTNQTLTNTFTDIGDAIGPDSLSIPSTGEKTRQFSFLVFMAFVTMNDSKKFQIRALGIDKTDNKRATMPIRTGRKDKILIRRDLQEFDESGDFTDLGQLFEFEIDLAFDAVQMQVRVDTEGATAGVVDSIRLNPGYRQ